MRAHNETHHTGVTNMSATCSLFPRAELYQRLSGWAKMLINHMLRRFHFQPVGICAFIVTNLLAAIEADRPAKAQNSGTDGLDT